MHTNPMFAVSGALIAAVAAVPMNKRDMVLVTETDMTYVTVAVTTTVWVDPSYATPPAALHYGHHGSHRTKTVQSTIIVRPTPAAYRPAAVAPAAVDSSSSRSEYVAPATSSVYVAPAAPAAYVAPTTSVYVAPTTTPAASAYTSAASGSGSGMSYGEGKSGTSYTGDLTWYDVGLGSCGWTSGSDDAIVAISHVIMDSYNNANPNNNPICGKMVNIIGVDGTTYPAKVVDTCPGCGQNCLDLSLGFFNKVTNNGNGRVHDIKWSFQ